MTVPTLEIAPARSRPPSPYVGLVPFGEDDAEFFFGRTQEVGVISANLRSARLTIVYGPSGVGKSSLLQAGVVHRLRQESRVAIDVPFAVCAVRSWLDEDPGAAVLAASRAALQDLSPNVLPESGTSLVESFREWTDEAGTLLVVLDQFEEYFQYHPESGDGEELTGFAAQLAEVINEPNLAVNVLISIREDAWAKLDRFEGHVPMLFANYLRVDHLDVGSAREAIEGPIAAWNRTLAPGEAPYDIEPALIGAVLTAAAGGLALGSDDRPVPSPAVAEETIEAPFLQLVLERLWRDAVAAGDHVLTLARLDALGGPRKIVENHLLEALGGLGAKEQDVASDCFRFLVSRSRTKIAHSADDLAEWTKRPVSEVTPVLDRLCSAERGRILRAVAPAAGAGALSYELFHDVLAEPILAWRQRHERERSLRAARRRFIRIGSVALAIVAALTALSIWAVVERGHAQNRAHALRVFNTSLQTQNESLKHDELTLSTRLRNRRAAAARTLVALGATNRGLLGDVSGLRARRDALTRAIATLVVRNRRLAAEVVRLNGENKALAAEVNRLDAEATSLEAQLSGLQQTEETLSVDADVLKAEIAALNKQLGTLSRGNEKLQRTAAALGYFPPRVFTPPVTSGQVPERHRPTTAAQFGIPAQLATSDALRRRVAALQRKLGQLRAQAGAAKALRNENTILRQQRVVLREENTRLAVTRVRLDTRRLELEQTQSAASAEHERLGRRAATHRLAYRKDVRAVATQRKANAKLQNKDNGAVDQVGYLQDQIATDQYTSGKLVSFLRTTTNKLIQGAEKSSQDVTLGALLAAEAYETTPYDPDDPAHPGVYNALWIALDRLDPNAAAKLIAPVAKPRGKVGTTSSATLRTKVCAFVKRGFTQTEWETWLPASASGRYQTATSNPCR